MLRESFFLCHPDQWKNIKAACEKNKVDLGLWIAIRRAKQKDLLWNLEDANVVTWIVDFDPSE
ncbi:MAG: hypothetical protein ACLVEJ_15465 [Parabacteroides sp.]